MGPAFLYIYILKKRRKEKTGEQNKTRFRPFSNLFQPRLSSGLSKIARMSVRKNKTNRQGFGLWRLFVDIC